VVVVGSILLVPGGQGLHVLDGRLGRQLEDRLGVRLEGRLVGQLVRPPPVGTRIRSACTAKY
jgi:hypothetical protein